MKENQPIRLIRACTEDTGILVDTLAWLDTKRKQKLDSLADAKELAEIYRLQGEARCLESLWILLSGMAKAKGQVVDEQPRIRRAG